jgi:flavin reductase (DIM6/NTAB) family NADH-FMN oxidoreductase RutF
MTIDPKQTPPGKMHALLLGAVIPRPIAFASTVDEQGQINLSPFSFFNVFSARPPVLVFSPARRARNNTVKHTYENVKRVPEVVINLVNYTMVQQASLASCEYPKGVNEFVKAGFTQVASTLIKPPRVGESPVSFECQVKQVVELGAEGGAGNLVICEVVLMHINERVLDAEGRVDPIKLDAVARLGQDYYCRVQDPNIFVVAKPNEKLGIGFDALPAAVRNSAVLTGNDLAQLANVEALPPSADVQLWRQSAESKGFEKATTAELHQQAKSLIAAGDIASAWKLLLAHAR